MPRNSYLGRIAARAVGSLAALQPPRLFFRPNPGPPANDTPTSAEGSASSLPLPQQEAPPVRPRNPAPLRQPSVPDLAEQSLPKPAIVPPPRAEPSATVSSPTPISPPPSAPARGGTPLPRAVAVEAEAEISPPTIIHRSGPPKPAPVHAKVVGVSPGESKTPPPAKPSNPPRASFIVESPPAAGAPARGAKVTEAAPPQSAPSPHAALQTQARPEKPAATPPARTPSTAAPPGPLVRAVLQPSPPPPPAAAAVSREPPQQAIRIGSIEVEVLPPEAPTPAVPPPAKPKSAVTLARDFTSSFGLRQG
jgi:hypothetical protein